MKKNASIFSDGVYILTLVKKSKVLKIIALVLLFMTIFIILGGAFAIFLITKDVNLKNYDLEATAQDIGLYDASDAPAEYPEKYKIEVKLEDISPYIVNAFIALEDKRFYTHHGLDYRRIAGALINNIKAGYFKEGGSTITQQLAKNAILTNEKSLVRKLKEAKLARQIEKRYTKDQILEMYLNTIYFGHSLYGVNAAAKGLFAKDPLTVTLSEAAILAGIVKNPKKNSPLNSPENALKRRDLVLGLMTEQGYITEAERDLAMTEGYVRPDSLSDDEADLKYAAAAIREAADILGISEKQLLTGGYSVYTYMDAAAQSEAVKLMSADAYSEENSDSLILVADNATGGIKAYCSTLSIYPGDFRRQPASAIKPILSYAPAFESGKYIPSSPILDEPQTFQGYSPKNYKNSYLGWTDVAAAARASSNIAALKMTTDVGWEYCKSFAMRCGITFDQKDALASVLGGMTYGVTPKEITEAYLSVAAGGVHKKVTFIRKITRGSEVLYSANARNERVMSEESAYLLTDMLTGCAESGTAKKLKDIPFSVAAKTGTNGDGEGNTDAWCMSYSALDTMCVWYGAKNGKKMPLSLTGGGLPAKVSAEMYSHADTEAATDFIAPDGIFYADIDTYSYDKYHVLELAGENTPYEYRKSVLMSSECIPAVSTRFDDPLPHDFEVKSGDGETVISFTASDRFIYYVTDLDGNVVASAEPDGGKKEIAVAEYGFGIRGYRIEAYTADGVAVAATQPKIAFIFGSGTRKFPFDFIP